MIDKEDIVEEIRRTAEENGGKPLGRDRFAKETGIRISDWEGRYWARWNDAVREAGIDPNAKQEAFSEAFILGHLASLARQLGHFPTSREIMMRTREGDGFPTLTVFTRRYGTKEDQAKALVQYCEGKPEYEDVFKLLGPLSPDPTKTAEARRASVPIGFVYLIKSGRHYKIGRTNAVGAGSANLLFHFRRTETGSRH